MDGIYVFDRCMPDGDIDVINIEMGEVLKRSWPFRCNAPIEIQNELKANERSMGESIDPLDILHGADGELYDEDGNFLATINEFHAQISPSVADVQAAGNMIEWGITTGYQITLEFTELVVHDRMLIKIIQGLQTGRSMPELRFTAIARSHAN